MNKRIVRWAIVLVAGGAMGTLVLTERVAAQEPAREIPAAKERASTGPSSAATQPDPRTVIGSAGDVTVTVGEYDRFMRNLPPQAQAQVQGQPELRRQVMGDLLKGKVLAAEAARRRLDEQEETKNQLDLQLKYDRDQILTGALVRSIRDDVEGSKKYFDEHKDYFDELEARHILVSTVPPQDPRDPKQPLSDAQAKAKADEVRKRLASGEDFAQVAKTQSDDQMSAANGGGLGIFGRYRMDPAFEKTAYGLKLNEISQPVKSSYGYHIIQLQKRQPNSFENAKELVLRKRIEDLIDKLTEGKPEKLDPKLFGPGPAEAATTAPATRPAAEREPRAPAARDE